MEALEDTDGTVRECARQSVVELFTGPGVTDAARADLKKEMTKKGVRKGIVDGVLQQVLAGGASSPATGSEVGSDHGEASTGRAGYVPPSIALKGKRPGPSKAAGLSKSSSQKEMSRPASRAAVTSPVPGEGGSGSSDVKAVYVGSHKFVLRSGVIVHGADGAYFFFDRLHRPGI